MSGYACLAFLVPALVFLAVVAVMSLALFDSVASSPDARNELTTGDLQQYGTRVSIAATDITAPGMHYGVVVDCGSSGSRVYVYYWPPHDGTPKQLLDIRSLVTAGGDVAIKKIEPGMRGVLYMLYGLQISKAVN